MKVIAVNGSARKDGNTAILIRRVFEELNSEKIDTELIQLSGEKIQGCTACGQCFIDKNQRCVIDNDIINDCIKKMKESDGIILGSPTYFADCSSQLKAFMDRTGFVARANNDLFKRKICAAVVAVRRAGAIHAFDSINHFFTIGQMIIVGSTYWNIGIGHEANQVLDDAEGIQTMSMLGKNMAWLMKKVTD